MPDVAKGRRYAVRPSRKGNTALSGTETRCNCGWKPPAKLVVLVFGVTNQFGARVPNTSREGTYGLLVFK